MSDHYSLLVRPDLTVDRAMLMRIAHRAAAQEHAGFKEIGASAWTYRRCLSEAMRQVWERVRSVFERWRRQIAAAQTSMTIVAAREKLYRENDRVHAQASDLIDEILSFKATSVSGLKIQVQAALVDFDPDALFLDPDPRHRGFFESLCAFTSIELPPCHALAARD